MGPSRIVRALYALFGYSSVQWAAGCWVRALIWDALFVGYVAFIFHAPSWILFAIYFGQAIDAALLEPKSDRANGGYAIAGLIASCVALVFAVTVRATWVEAFKIPSGSSIPTLLIGDHVFVDKTARHPARGETTVFIYPREPDKVFVKRIVAVGGDTVEIRDDQLVINGQPVPRQHVDEPCAYDDYAEDSRRWESRPCEAWDETLDGRTYRVVFDRNGFGPHSTRPVTVAPDSYFALGDNRDNSHDSRYWGFVPQALIKGVVRKIWFSEGPEGTRWSRVDQRVR